MIKRMSEAYGVPVALIVLVSVSGLLAFCGVFGIAIYSGLVEQWPEIPTGLAVALSVVGPLVIILAVGIGGAIHDRCCIEQESDEEATAANVKN